MPDTYHGIVTGVRVKTGPSGRTMTHFNLRVADGTVHHVIAMREGINQCRGVGLVREGLSAVVTGEWGEPRGGRKNLMARRLRPYVTDFTPGIPQPEPTEEPESGPVQEPLWWDWEILQAS